MTSPEPVDINAIAPIVSTSIPPALPNTVSAIKGVTNPVIKYKNYGKKSIPRELLNQNKDMQIADSVLLSLFKRDKPNCRFTYLLPFSDRFRCIGILLDIKIE